MDIIRNPANAASYVITSNPDARGSCDAFMFERQRNGRFSLVGRVTMKIYPMIDETIPSFVATSLECLRAVQGTGELVRPFLEAFPSGGLFYVAQPDMQRFELGFTELAENGSFVASPQRPFLAEHEGRVALRQMANTMQTLHQRGYCVPGLSLTNLFIDDNGHIVFDVLDLIRPIPPDGMFVRYPEENFPADLLPFVPPEVYVHYPHDPRARDAWAIVCIALAMMVRSPIYACPHQSDIGFRLFIVARALSTDFANELAEEVIDELTSANILALVPILQRTMAFSPELFDLLGHALDLHPIQRWGVAEILASDWLLQI